MKYRNMVVEAVVLLALIAILLWYNIPFSVNQQISALEIKMDDPSYCVERTITLDGKRHRNLFSDDKFRGSLTVSGYEDMIGDRVMDDLILASRSPITYTVFPDEKLELFRFGYFHTEQSFKDMVITFVNNPDGYNSTEDCYVIVANVPDRETAHVRAKKALWPSESQ